MATFRVKANPKAGTCFQDVEADSVNEAIDKAWENPNGWVTPRISNGNKKEWFFHARELTNGG